MPKDRSYWQQRFDQIEQSANNQSVTYVQELEEKYRIATQAIEGKIEAWYQRLAQNNKVSVTEARRLLQQSELEEFHWTVEQYIKAGKENAIDERWLKELENASARFHINRLEALKLDIRQQIELAIGGLVDNTYTLLRNVYADTFYHSCFELQKGIGIGFDIAKVDDKKVVKLLTKPWSVDGTNFSEKLWGNKAKLINTLDKELSRMVLTGESPQRAIANVKKAMKTSQKAAARVVMTEQAFFTTAAQKDSYQELDVEEYEFVCTLDKITCELCGAMDGKHFPINELEVGVNAPPMHPFCRCITCPYFNDEFIVGKRASRDENGKTVYEVPEKMKYEEWKERFINKDFHFEEKNIEKSSTIVDIVFQSKLPNSKVMNDKKTVIKAFSELPIKVQQKMNNVVFNMGNSGSGCDYKNGIIYVAQGAEKQDIYHEIGHLLEYRMMDKALVDEYKRYLVENVSPIDVCVETYYNDIGDEIQIVIIRGSRFVSEYQGRIYVNNKKDAFNADGSIKTELMFETISEPFRMYQNNKEELNGHDMIIELIERAIQ